MKRVLIAVWLLPWTAVLGISETAFAVSNPQRTVDPSRHPNWVYDGQRWVNLGSDPVNPNRQIDWNREDEYVLEDFGLGKVGSASGRTVRGWVTPGTAVAMDKASGQMWIVSCGNPVTFERQPRWKKIEHPQCPICPPPETKIEWRDRPVYEAPPALPPPAFEAPVVRERPWCLRGVGPVVCFGIPIGLVAAGIALGHHSSKCSNCGCPTCPPRTKPNP